MFSSPLAEEGSIVAFLALGTANVLYCYAVFGTGPQIRVEMLVDAVELIAVVAGRIREIDLGRAVAVDTPAHAQRSELLHFVHFLDWAVAGLTLNFTGLGMLGMTEEDMVREAMDLYPFHRLGVLGIVFGGLGIVACIAV